MGQVPVTVAIESQHRRRLQRRRQRRGGDYRSAVRRRYLDQRRIHAILKLPGLCFHRSIIAAPAALIVMMAAVMARALREERRVAGDAATPHIARQQQKQADRFDHSAQHVCLQNTRNHRRKGGQSSRPVREA